jgi:hypothetical protein
MPHARTQVRDAVIAAVTGLATTGASVFAGRTRNLGTRHPPALLVYARETRTVADTQRGVAVRKLAHTLRLFVEGRVSRSAANANEDVARKLEDQLDQVELEVGAAIGADATLGGKVKDILLIGSTLSAQAPGESHEGEVRMEFEVQYRTAEDAPGVIIP